VERTRTLGTLAADVIKDFALLGSGVAEMAKTEATYQGKVAARRLGFAVFGGLLAVHGVVAILYALAATLVSRNFPDARMYAVVALLTLAIAGLCVWLAARKPRQALAQTPATRPESRPLGAAATPLA
jgi:hypothetical protein